MLSKEDNELLTRVGPGTPGGDLMRRYWHPVATSQEIAENPVKAVRILGESLTLYRDRQGEMGLIGQRCAHRSVDMRYGYQVHELNVPLPEGTEELTESDIEALYPRFDAIYEETYGKGSAYREAGMEFITFRVTGVGLVQKPHITETPLCNVPVEQALKTRRQVFFQEQGDFVSTPIYDYKRMVPGMEIAGPAVIESPITTIIVNPQDRTAMDEYRNVRISVVQ